jgi:hypothetical protein
VSPTVAQDQVAPPLSTIDLLSIETACRRLICSFWHYLDSAEFESLGALMAPDGVWYRHGETLRGPAGVLAAMKTRSPTLQTQHLISNLIIHVESPVSARGLSRMQLFRHDDGQAIALPLPMEGPQAVYRYEHAFVRVADVWRISSHRSTQMFARASQRPLVTDQS